jgi:HK97 family phage portal protein
VKFFKWGKPKAATLKEPEFFRQTELTGEAGTTVNVNPNSAMRIGTVYACVRILAETVASLPIGVYQRVNGKRIEVEQHPLNYLLGTSFNGEQTAMEGREFVMSSLGLRGNAYCAVLRSNRGGVSAIHNLKPGYSRLERDGSQRLRLVYEEPNNEMVLPESALWRVAGLGSDGVTGLSPIALARDTLGLSIAMERSANRIFANGAQSSTTLEFDHTLTEEQIDHLRAQWAENYAGWKNAGKPLILESGMKAKAIGMSNADAQFLESRKAQVGEIARWYRVPLHMLGDLDRATFSNIEHQSIEFVTHTIRPWLVRIEQAIVRDLLGDAERRRGLYVEHTVEGLLRGDIKTRYEAYSSAITNGWMSRNEVRRLENFNDADGLDEYMVPLNMGNASAENLANAENRALIKEADKSAAEFAAWLPGFLDRRVTAISETLGVDASYYKNARIARMAGFSEPSDAVAEAVKHTLADIEALKHE